MRAGDPASTGNADTQIQQGYKLKKKIKIKKSTNNLYPSHPPKYPFFPRGITGIWFLAGLHGPAWIRLTRTKIQLAEKNLMTTTGGKILSRNFCSRFFPSIFLPAEWNLPGCCCCTTFLAPPAAFSPSALHFTPRQRCGLIEGHLTLYKPRLHPPGLEPHQSRV